MTAIITVGHGTLSSEAFVEACLGAAVATVVDIRTAPGSRHNPQFQRDRMKQWLPDAGIAYRWEPRLGGFRKPSPDSSNFGLRHPAFRGYADHMATAGFSGAVTPLLEDAAAAHVAVMCSETVWWRCHRRLLADHLTLVGGVDVLHLMPPSSLLPHRVTPGAVVDLDHVIYPPG